jgi:hypothetical protein
MSDTRRVEFDTKRAEPAMSQVVVVETRDMLETLMKREHRGPSDTWTAARDRTAMKIGIEPAQARRVWQRWQDMKDVPGSVYRAIRNAYDAQCEHNEKMAALHRQRREELAHGGEDHSLMAQPNVGMAPVPARASETAAQAVSRAG